MQVNFRHVYGDDYTVSQWLEVYAVLTDGKNIQAGISKKVKRR